MSNNTSTTNSRRRSGLHHNSRTRSHYHPHHWVFALLSLLTLNPNYNYLSSAFFHCVIRERVRCCSLATAAPLRYTTQLLLEKMDQVEQENKNKNNSNMDAHESVEEDLSFNHFQYVDMSIGAILNKHPPLEKKSVEVPFVHQETACLNWNELNSFITTNIYFDNDNDNGNDNDTHNESNNTKNEKKEVVISMDLLITIASQCEERLFPPETFDNNNNNSKNSKNRDDDNNNNRNSRDDKLQIPSPIQGLLNLSSNNPTPHENHANIVTATLLSLNMLESSIRVLAQKEHGRAPLLKDMIEIINERSKSDDSKGQQLQHQKPLLLSPILRSLLLPNKGINLRNLLWHGFISKIHKRWLALCIVLTLSMDLISGTSRNDEMKNSESSDEDLLLTFKRMREHDSLAQILNCGHGILSSNNEMEVLKEELIQSKFIPPTHKELLHAAFDTSSIRNYPVISVAVMSILIEHGLRLWWCDVNKMDERIAKPGAYYVTLDGHSQKDKHDVILLPFLSNKSKNKLVYELGGPMMALLADLFASPPGGGPNIRASIAHGLYNEYLYKELTNMDNIAIIGNGGNRGESCHDRDHQSTIIIHDMAHALLFLFRIIASKKLKMNDSNQGHHQQLISSYRPIFSYSASVRGIDNAMSCMKTFQEMIESEELIINALNSIADGKQKEVYKALSTFDKDRVLMNLEMKNNILTALSLNSSSIWSDEDAFKEVDSNLILSGCGASMLLLDEITDNVNTHIHILEKALSESNDAFHTCSSRRRKQISRIFSMVGITYTFYNVCVLCAMLHIQHKIPKTDDHSSGCQQLSDETLLLHAVKRSRMVASTFSTTKNPDRAIKAIAEYLLGKSIKPILKISPLL